MRPKSNRNAQVGSPTPHLKKWQAGSSPYPEDGLGNVVAVSNWQGALIETYRYDAFGNTTITGPDGGPRKYAGNLILGNRMYGFTGREYEINTGLYYYRARYHNPAIGRFLQPDRIGYIEGLNMYAYVLNSPTAILCDMMIAKMESK